MSVRLHSQPFQICQLIEDPSWYVLYLVIGEKPSTKYHTGQQPPNQKCQTVSSIKAIQPWVSGCTHSQCTIVNSSKIPSGRTEIPPDFPSFPLMSLSPHITSYMHPDGSTNSILCVKQHSTKQCVCVYKGICAQYTSIPLHRKCWLY